MILDAIKMAEQAIPNGKANTKMASVVHCLRNRTVKTTKIKQTETMPNLVAGDLCEITNQMLQKNHPSAMMKPMERPSQGSSFCWRLDMLRGGESVKKADVFVWVLLSEQRLWAWAAVQEPKSFATVVYAHNCWYILLVEQTD